MSSVLRAMGRSAIHLDQSLQRAARGFLDRLALNDYMRSDRRPWRNGYHFYRLQYLTQVLHDPARMQLFRQSQPLPAGYGFRLDARMVEIPWALSRIGSNPGRLLDAGSSLNSEPVLMSPALANQKMTIVTLAPEPTCLWHLGISYVYGDLRALDFRDDWFDTIICISTIEHIGMDNSLYAGSAETGRRSDPKDLERAVKELRRVCKPGGALYLTFPFGRYQDHGWFQQFDTVLLDRLVEIFRPSHCSETIFRYDPEGWRVSDRAACAQCEFFDVRTSKYFDPRSTIEYPADYPAGERAVACLELTK